MQIIPAIDLRAGRTVRLLRGDFGRETVYDDDPVAVARRWCESGAELVHVVDLDGAKVGRSQQLPLIEQIAMVAPVQVGGGLRTRQDVQDALTVGVTRVVIGTVALDSELVGELADVYGDQLVVALDARDGMVAVEGWTRSSEISVLDLARRLINSGAKRFLHTDVARDGTLTSPNFTSLEALIALGVPVLASGGVSSLDDVRRLREIGAEGAIVGRALYEGTIDLGEAVSVAR